MQCESTGDSESERETEGVTAGQGLGRKDIAIRRQRYEEMVEREGELDACEVRQVEEVVEGQRREDDEVWAVRSNLCSATHGLSTFFFCVCLLEQCFMCKDWHADVLLVRQP